MELMCKVQNYGWGKLGQESLVAQLQQSINPDVEILSETPYAELWMGTHPNGPSNLMDTQVSLKDFIEKDPSVLGNNVVDKFGSDLPFLLKILSVNKALSIQAHPDKSLAEKLHIERPDIYKDSNHKPELAIALTPFQGLCGFRPLHEIQENMRTYEEFRNVIGEECAQDLLQMHESKAYKGPLKNAFQSLMKGPKELLERNLISLKTKLMEKSDLTELEKLFLRLLSQYPGDVGCFVIFMVNFVKLQPGEAMFLGPNLVHAYLEGDCVECMACSDNVVRAGLTPKLIDVDTLCSMLEYKCCSSPDDVKLSPKNLNANIQCFEPPVHDFAVRKITCQDAFHIPELESASIVIVTDGEGQYRTEEKEKLFRKGTILFIKAKEKVIFSPAKQSVGLFQAYCNTAVNV